ncbi:hypothetical protein HanXRQr2_Chr03g0091301 [Helianthus annuus]|uniref:Uncharacterized protein n=1 Tax=Helianthus annuus TaxID=4232 RepID=A0A9K3JD71_HELAN|nr:hypothetical protein HanXRQr2_Chr03g0091301 [Helianthus annuus]KAJ0606666.1 hypothetical protein HanHA89_Chr03g0087741 [Helianthus annuus]KAJ0766731.1 hypothetical protein HanLR1_Chr03g0080941 [Helianthus annuus]
MHNGLADDDGDDKTTAEQIVTQVNQVESFSRKCKIIENAKENVRLLKVLIENVRNENS